MFVVFTFILFFASTVKATLKKIQALQKYDMKQTIHIVFKIFARTYAKYALNIIEIEARISNKSSYEFLELNIIRIIIKQ